MQANAVGPVLLQLVKSNEMAIKGSAEKRELTEGKDPQGCVDMCGKTQFLKLKA